MDHRSLELEGLGQLAHGDRHFDRDVLARQGGLGHQNRASAASRAALALDTGLAVATQEAALFALAQLGGGHAASGTGGLAWATLAAPKGGANVRGGIILIGQAAALALALGLCLGCQDGWVDATDDLASGSGPRSRCDRFACRCGYLLRIIG